MTKKEKIDSIMVYNSRGKEVDRLEPDRDIFTDKVNFSLLHQVALMHQARMRRGTASTKVRDEVSGGGVKPWRQKGTGRARAGDIRSPIWRKGGVVFGPKPRDFSYDLPKSLRRNALISAINAKMIDKKVLAVDEIAVKEPKTKVIKEILDNLGLKERVLLIADACSGSLKLSCRNLKGLTLRKTSDFNVLDVLVNDYILFTKKAFESLGERFKSK